MTNEEIIKNVIIIGLTCNFIEGTGKTITDFIPNFETREVEKLFLKYIKDDETLEKYLKEIVNEAYNLLMLYFQRMSDEE